jgi:hypothetical protein
VLDGLGVSGVNGRPQRTRFARSIPGVVVPAERLSTCRVAVDRVEAAEAIHEEVAVEAAAAVAVVPAPLVRAPLLCTPYFQNFKQAQARRVSSAPEKFDKLLEFLR